MKENRKLLKEVLKDIRHDVTDEEVPKPFTGCRLNCSRKP